MADTNSNVNPVVPTVTVSAEVAAKMHRVYLGMPDNRQSEIDEVVKARGISRHQAVMENILYPKVDLYVEKAAEKEAENLNKALRLLVDLGKVKDIKQAQDYLAQLAAQSAK